MNTTSPIVSSSRRSQRSAFFSSCAWLHAHLFTVIALVFVLLPCAIRADLLVLQPGGGANPNAGSAIVWRFDAASGTAIANFGHDNEGFYAMTVTRDNEVFVTSNILGYYDLYRFTREGQYRGIAESAIYGDFRGVSRAADGILYGLMRRGDFNSTGMPPAFVARFDRPGGTTLVANGTGGMFNPTWMVLGPDGQIYVADADVGIMRFDRATGAPLGVLVPLGRGGLTSVSRMLFGPDGRLYVSNGSGNSVLRFDGVTGDFIDTFVAAGSGGLSNAVGLAFGDDGRLYVASRDSHQVMRYDGTTGAFVDVFVTDIRLRYPRDIAFTRGSSIESVWFDDAPPPGAAVSGEGWEWTASSPVPATGALALRSPRPPNSVPYVFNFASEPMTVGTGDTLFVNAWVDGAQEIMLSWCDEANWEHRAYWGADMINEGQNGTASRRYMGRLPTTGSWARLEVPARLIGLEGRAVQGFSIEIVGTATFDTFGKTVAGASAPSGPDTTPPMVEIRAPLAGATVSGDVWIDARATDNSGRATLGFFIDGTASGDGSSWRTASYTNGPHVVRVVATDTAGNSAETSITVTVDNPTAPPPPTPQYWVDDALPPGAWGSGSGGDGWNWVSANPAPFVGARAHQSNIATGLHEHYFNDASPPLTLAENDLIIAHVFLDPANPPRELMLSFFDGTSWEHRAFWGFDFIQYGVSNTDSRRFVGPMPSAGQWVRLEVPASRVGLVGRSIAGVGFAAFDGRVTWDGFGKTASTSDVTPPTLAITSPTDGASVSGMVTLAATATDDSGVSDVSFGIGETDWRPDSSAPYTSEWDTTRIPNGSYTVTVVARDSRNNVAERTITVAVNNDAGTTDVPPQVRFTLPAAAPQALSGTIQVSVDATDDRGIAWVMFRMPGAKMGPRITAPPYSMQWDTRSVRSGQHTITAWAADTRGQEVTSSIRINVDHVSSGDVTPPTISITSPAAGATVSENVSVRVNASDNYGMSEVRFYLDGNSIGSDSEPPYEYSWPSRNAANGAHTLQVAAFDLAGQTSTTSISVTVNNPPLDQTAPTVAFTAPANDTEVSGNVTISATASDNAGVASVQFFLDGAELQAADTTAPYSVSWDSRTVADGSHVLAAIATDTGGRTSSRATITVHVNNAGTPPPPGPDVAWFDDDLPAGASPGGNGGDGWTWVTSNPAPAAGTRAHQSNIAAGLHEHYFDWAYAGQFAVSSSDTLFAWVHLDPANPPRQIMLSWRDESGWEHRAYWGANLIGYGTDGTPSRRRIGDLPALGVWTKLTVPASAVGLGSSALLGMSFSVFDGRATWDATGKLGGGAADTTLPNVAITAPAAGSTVSGSSTTIAASATDDTGVASVAFYVGTVLLGTDTTAPFSITWNTTTASDGNHTLTALARDAVGNQRTSAPVSVTVDNESAPATDTTPPNVSISTPNDGATVSGTTVSLGAFASDNVGVASVQFRIDGVLTGTPITTPPFNTTWNSTSVGNGSHTVSATARDAAGNEGTSASRIFSVNNSSSGGAVIWMDSAIPPGAWTSDTWTWVTSNPTPFAGTRAHRSPVAAGLHSHSFNGASQGLRIFAGDTLFVYVHLDSANPPRALMVSWFDGDWEQRAYWGENLFPYGTDGTTSRRRMGLLPATGQWVQLQIPAAQIGLEGRYVTGMSFSLFDGGATWDIVGRVQP